jgi:hypothetical protein
MNSNAFVADPGPTIRDVEQRIEHVLDRLRVTCDETPREDVVNLLAELRQLFAPRGFRCVAQLEEDGRKKRSNASASNWKLDTGEIVLYFEPIDDAAGPPSLQTSVIAMTMSIRDSVQIGSIKSEIQQCCVALAEAERAGKQFIALKWFRDLALAGLPYEWAQTTEDRQRVLSAAIDSGAIILKRIPNPKSPMHPTSTVSLNRVSSFASVPSRFNPVPIKGEPASKTLLRDRGSF